jgi:hypothetical protein
MTGTQGKSRAYSNLRECLGKIPDGKYGAFLSAIKAGF